jgi:D-3-phosphoglycerate dehydrogenase
MKKILITDSISDKCIKKLESVGYDVDYKTDLSPDTLKEKIKDYNALIVRSASKITSGIIKNMENMEVIGRAGTGVDNIDIDSATKKGILVLNTPGGNTISAAEHTMAMMLSMCRLIPMASKSLSEKKWDRKTYKGSELQDKTLGLLGLGKIGREVAKRAQGFGMKVIAYDPLLSSEVAEKLNVTLHDIDDIFTKANIISVHVPLNDKTRYLVSEETLSKCKDGVKIINCARGGIVNESDLLNALSMGKVSAAALDVFESEPPDTENKLLNHPKVVCTPHLGASTAEAQEKVAIQIAEQISDYLLNNRISGAVNAPSVQKEIPNRLMPFVKLSEVVGLFHSQIMKGQLNNIEITFWGDDLNSISELLTASLLKGLLTRQISERVNLINAQLLAKEEGIAVKQIKSSETRTYNNLIRVCLNSNNLSRIIEGTVVGINELRIINIDGFPVDFDPIGKLILYYNKDVPGILASVSSMLANEQINIAGLSLGRIEEGKEALTVIKIDSDFNYDLLERSKSIEGIKSIYSVTI